MSRHGNIAVFIPHLGCPNMCSFCNQRTISSTASAPTPEQVREMLEKACADLSEESRSHTEIAFFGGSFTAIDRDYMTALLESAYPYVKSGMVHGIRCSTRPDKIDREILDILKGYGVTAIELGAQSMNDNVLSANNRGHTAEDAEKASALIKEYGFELGLQMMVGLYKSTPETDMDTARKIISLAPETVRIYPTVILKNTRLGELFEMGEYVPYPFERAADVCAEMLEMFEKVGIKVIKLGLHASETVETDMIGGYYHPAFREICEGLLFRKSIEQHISVCGNYMIYVSSHSVSKALGHKKSNVRYFAEKGIGINIRSDDRLKNREIIVKKDEENVSGIT